MIPLPRGSPQARDERMAGQLGARRYDMNPIWNCGGSRAGLPLDAQESRAHRTEAARAAYSRATELSLGVCRTAQQW